VEVKLSAIDFMWDSIAENLDSVSDILETSIAVVPKVIDPMAVGKDVCGATSSAGVVID
jgi:hypothetical protein